MQEPSWIFEVIRAALYITITIFLGEFIIVSLIKAYYHIKRTIEQHDTHEEEKRDSQ